jgi:pimeloyl-ACP methyl ester carboxylesterase
MTGQRDAAEGASSFAEFGLHCVRESASDLIVIFVHGILSSGETAWGHPSWPELLANDPDLQGQDIGVFVFTYQTSLRSRSYSVADVSDALREHFTLADLWRVGKVVFVCHSLGGIVVRRFLVANQARLIKLQPTIGLFLVATPSLGSRDANLFSLLSYTLQHTQAAALRFSQANTSLDELHRDFRTLLNSRQLTIKGRELTEDKAIKLKRWLGLRRLVV